MPKSWLCSLELLCSLPCVLACAGPHTTPVPALQSPLLLLCFALL